MSVNREMILLYLDLGQRIVERQEQAGWGSAVLDRLSRDLQTAFPGVAGFSRRNLYRMRASTWPTETRPKLCHSLWHKYRGATTSCCWRRTKTLISGGGYIQQTVENGWSRAILVDQIETDLYGRQVAAAKITNFSVALPPPQSDLAQQALKDPYVFDFLSLGKETQERDLERGLLERIKDFLLELGAGFAFMGSQYHLEVGGQDFYVDLLFYHHRLRCLVAIDLKMNDYKPEYAGKMNIYLTVVWHAQARCVAVLIAVEGESLVVEVVDDGRGFDVAACGAAGHGLGSMRARAAQLGGVLAVERRRGRVVRLVVRTV